MNNKTYCNPILKSRLSVFFQTEDWSALVEYIDTLTNRDFRSVGNIIGEYYMPLMSESSFWNLFYRLITYNSKAFLVTMLKSLPKRISQGTFDIYHNGFIVVSNYLTTTGTLIDRKKFVAYLLPELYSPDEADYMLTRLHINSPGDRIDVFLHFNTPAVYFLLFRSMREIEHDRLRLVDICVTLMKKGDTVSFNMASMMKLYFDLSEVKGTFSLRLNPYELGRLDLSYDAFRNTLLSI